MNTELCDECGRTLSSEESTETVRCLECYEDVPVCMECASELDQDIDCCAHCTLEHEIADANAWME